MIKRIIERSLGRMRWKLRIENLTQVRSDTSYVYVHTLIRLCSSAVCEIATLRRLSEIITLYGWMHVVCT